MAARRRGFAARRSWSFSRLARRLPRSSTPAREDAPRGERPGRQPPPARRAARCRPRHPGDQPVPLRDAPAQPGAGIARASRCARDLSRSKFCACASASRDRAALWIRGRVPAARAAAPPAAPFPDDAAAPRPAPAAFSPPMKQAADHALQGRRDARANHGGGCARDGTSRRRGSSAHVASVGGAPSIRGRATRYRTDRRAKALEQKAALEAQMARTARWRRPTASAARRTPPRTPSGPRLEDRRRREEGERAKKQRAAAPRHAPRAAGGAREEAAEPAPRGADDAPAPPAPRSPRQPPSAQLRCRGRRRSSSTARAHAARRRLQPPLAAEGARRARARLGGAGHENLRRRPGKGGLGLRARVAAELERFQDDRRRARRARRAAPERARRARDPPPRRAQPVGKDLRARRCPRGAAPGRRRRCRWSARRRGRLGRDVARGRVDVVPLPERVAREGGLQPRGHAAGLAPARGRRHGPSCGFDHRHKAPRRAASPCRANVAAPPHRPRCAGGRRRPPAPRPADEATVASAAGGGAERTGSPTSAPHHVGQRVVRRPGAFRRARSAARGLGRPRPPPTRMRATEHAPRRPPSSERGGALGGCISARRGRRRRPTSRPRAPSGAAPRPVCASPLGFFEASQTSRASPSSYWLGESKLLCAREHRRAG